MACCSCPGTPPAMLALLASALAPWTLATTCPTRLLCRHQCKHCRISFYPNYDLLKCCHVIFSSAITLSKPPAVGWEGARKGPAGNLSSIISNLHAAPQRQALMN